ncbi:hypothetical protein KKG45_06215 [bacterium]|nr:hypothetical protein [bacterium]MBU1072822.1 hypothetical protein [bacterium]MBU1676313.1 hypothetical protein [bacterium]
MTLQTQGSGNDEVQKPVSKRRYDSRTSAERERDHLKPLRSRRNRDDEFDDYDPDYELGDDKPEDEDEDDLDLDDFDDYDEDEIDDDEDDDK